MNKKGNAKQANSELLAVANVVPCAKLN